MCNVLLQSTLGQLKFVCYFANSITLHATRTVQPISQARPARSMMSLRTFIGLQLYLWPTLSIFSFLFNWKEFYREMIKITTLVHFVSRSTHTNFLHRLRQLHGKIRFLIQLFFTCDAASTGCVVFVCHLILVVCREVVQNNTKPLSVNKFYTWIKTKQISVFCYVLKSVTFFSNAVLDCV